MPPKDYVSRNKPRGNKSKIVKKPFPWLAVVICIVIVVGFVSLLLTIQGASDNQPTALEQTLNAKDSPVKPSEPLPVLQKDIYGFPTDLEKDYAKDRLPSGEKLERGDIASDRQYMMQCGSFRKKHQANEMEATIAFQGLNAQVRASKGTTGLWYRVFLGPYQQKRQADLDRRKIETAGIYGCQIWNWEF